MNFVYFVKKDDLLPYMLVTVHDGGSEFRPMVAAADNAALTLTDRFRGKRIERKELAKIVGPGFIISEPVELTRNGEIQVKDFLMSAYIWTKGAGGYRKNSNAVPYTSDIVDMPIGSVGRLSDFNKVIAYKADAFLKEQHKSTFNYQVKRFKPVWDASIFWPNTGRRGGWRCPPEAGDNAGNFTNQFGRGCGFGVARRLANIVGGVGRALETQDDTRRAARATAQQGQQAAPSERRQRRIDRRNQRMIERLQAEEIETFGSLVPEEERDRRPLPIPEGAEVVPEDERTTELIPELGTEATSARRQAEERRRGAAIQEDIERPLKPRRGEELQEFLARSFDEYQKRARRMRQRGENVDDLDYDQWLARNEDRLRGVHEGAAARETMTQRARRGMSERRRRTEATDAVTRDTATRRPTDEDEIVEIGIPSPERERTVLAPEPDEEVTERMTDLERAADEARREREERVRAAREEAATEPMRDSERREIAGEEERKETVGAHRRARLGRKDEVLTNLDTTISNMEKALEEFERTGVWRGGDYGAPADIVKSDADAGELKPKNPPRNYTLDEIKEIYVKNLGPNATPEQIAEAEQNAQQNFSSMVRRAIRRQQTDRRLLADQIERKRIRREQNTVDIEDIPEEILAELEAEGRKMEAIKDSGDVDELFKVADSDKVVAMHSSQDILEGGRLSVDLSYGSDAPGASDSGNTKKRNKEAVKKFKDVTDERQKEYDSLTSIASVLGGESSTAKISSRDVLRQYFPFDNQGVASDPSDQELVDAFMRDGSVTIDFSQVKNGTERLEMARPLVTDKKLADLRAALASRRKTLDTLTSTGGEFQSAWGRPYVASSDSGYFGRYAGVQSIPDDIADILPDYELERGGKNRISDQEAYDRWDKQLRGGLFMFVGDRDSEIVSTLGPKSDDEMQIIAPLAPVFGISSTKQGDLSPVSTRGARIFRALNARAIAAYNRDGRVDIDTVLSDPTLAPEPVRSVTAGTAQATELTDIDIMGRSEAASATTDVLPDAEPTTAPDAVTEPPAPSPEPSAPRPTRRERRESRRVEREKRQQGERKRRAAEFRRREAERQARLESGGYFARSRFFGPESFFRIGPVLTGPTYDRDILGRQIPDALIPTRLRNERDRMLAEQSRQEAAIMREQERILQERERRERERARRNRERRERESSAEERRVAREEERAERDAERERRRIEVEEAEERRREIRRIKDERTAAEREFATQKRVQKKRVVDRMWEMDEKAQSEVLRLDENAKALKNRRDDAKVQYDQAKESARVETDPATKAAKQAEAQRLKAAYEALVEAHKLASGNARAAKARNKAISRARRATEDRLDVLLRNRFLKPAGDRSDDSDAKRSTDDRYLSELLRREEASIKALVDAIEADFESLVEDDIRREMETGRTTDTAYQEKLSSYLSTDEEREERARNQDRLASELSDANRAVDEIRTEMKRYETDYVDGVDTSTDETGTEPDSGSATPRPTPPSPAPSDGDLVSDIIDDLEADTPEPTETPAERAARELREEALSVRAPSEPSFVETGEIPDRPFWREDGYTGADKDALEEMFGILYEPGADGRLLSRIADEPRSVPETDATPESVETAEGTRLTPRQVEDRKNEVRYQLGLLDSEFQRGRDEATRKFNETVDNYERAPRFPANTLDAMAEAADRRYSEAREDASRLRRQIEESINSPTSPQEEIDRLLKEYAEATDRLIKANADAQIIDAYKTAAEVRAEDARLATEAEPPAPSPEPETSIPEAPPISRTPEQEIVFRQQEELEQQIRAENLELNMLNGRINEARSIVNSITDRIARINPQTIISPDMRELRQQLDDAIAKLSSLSSERNERLYKIRELEKVRGTAMREMPGDFMVDEMHDDLLRESFISVMEVDPDVRERVEAARIAAIETRKAARDLAERQQNEVDEAIVARARSAQAFIDDLLPQIEEEEDFTEGEPLTGERLEEVRRVFGEMIGRGDEEDGELRFDDFVTDDEEQSTGTRFAGFAPEVLDRRNAIGPPVVESELPASKQFSKASARMGQARRDYYEELNDAVGRHNDRVAELESGAVTPEPTPRTPEPEPRGATAETPDTPEVASEPETPAPTPDTETPAVDTAVSSETGEPESSAPTPEPEPTSAPPTGGRRRGGGGRRTGAARQTGGGRQAAAPDQAPEPRKMNRLADRRTPEMPSLSMTRGENVGGFRQVRIGNANIRTLDDALKYEGSLADIPDKFLIEALGERSFGAPDYADILMSDGVPEATAIERAEKLSDAVIAAVNGGELTDEARAALKEARDLGVPFFRYSTDTKGTGASLYFLIQEDGSIDGRGYIVKGPDADYGSAATHAEIVGADLARRWGFAYSTPRLVRRDALQWKIENGRVVPVLDASGNQKVTRNAAFMVGELGPNLAEGIVRNMKPTAEQRGEGLESRQDDVVDKESRLAAALLNAVLGSADRHPGNGMIFDGNGALPIDFGRSFTNMDKLDTPDKLAKYITQPYGADGERRLYGRIDSDAMAGWRAAYEEKIRSGMDEAEAQAELRQELRQFLKGLADEFEEMLGESNRSDTPYSRITQSFNQGSDMSGYSGTADVTELHYREDKLRRAQRILGGTTFADKLFESVLQGPPSPPARRSNRS